MEPPATEEPSRAGEGDHRLCNQDPSLRVRMTVDVIGMVALHCAIKRPIPPPQRERYAIGCEKCSGNLLCVEQQSSATIRIANRFAAFHPDFGPAKLGRASFGHTETIPWSGGVQLGGAMELRLRLPRQKNFFKVFWNFPPTGESNELRRRVLIADTR
jgi:hypothetical protein